MYDCRNIWSNDIWNDFIDFWNHWNSHLEKVIFKCLIGIGILRLIVPIGFGSLTGWSAYQSIKEEKKAEKEEAMYRKKYPIHARFQDDCKYGSKFQQLKKLVQEAGDNLNETDDGGYTILDQFIVEDWYDVRGLKVLLDAGADEKLKEDSGRTAADYYEIMIHP